MCRVTACSPASSCSGWVPDDSAEHRVPLAQAWAVPLEQAFPLAGSRLGNTGPARRGAYVGLVPGEYFSGAPRVQG